MSFCIDFVYKSNSVNVGLDNSVSSLAIWHAAAKTPPPHTSFPFPFFLVCGINSASHISPCLTLHFVMKMYPQILWCIFFYMDLCSHGVTFYSCMLFSVIFRVLKRTDGGNRVKQILYYLHS